MAAWYTRRLTMQMVPADRSLGVSSHERRCTHEGAACAQACPARPRLPRSSLVDASRRVPFIALVCALAPLLGACSKPAPDAIVDRLWVSSMPTSPRSTVDALMITDVGKRSVGSFYHGSLYRGAHDSFTWTSKGKDKGEIRLLQDQRAHAVQVRSCKPDVGFDQCILLEGDPKGVVRYQSRKRWVIPKRGKKQLDMQGVIAELAEDDEELEALLEVVEDDEQD